MKRASPLLLALLLGCSREIQHGLDEEQANEIEARLLEAGVEAKKSRESGREPRWSIAVPSDQAPESVRLLADLDLPRTRSPGFGEVFGSGRLVPTSTEEDALFVHALQGELSRTLLEFEGVVSARVHVVVPPRAHPSTLRPATVPRAAVLLKIRKEAAPALAERVGDVQALVAGSVDGLDPGNVAVVLSQLNGPHAAPGARPPTARDRGMGLYLAGTALLLALLTAGGLVGARTSRVRQLFARSHPPAPGSALPPPSPSKARSRAA